jgi:hypothetical protein
MRLHRPILNRTVQQQMPCACQLPPELYPDSSEWGPILWTLLHGVAERVGTVAFPLFQMDERRALVKFFQALGKMIPCPSCKDHYDSYLREHPVDKVLMELPYDSLRDYVRRWFWELHNWVNESHGKPIYPLESVRAAYKDVAIRQTIRALDIPMKKAIRVRGGQQIAYAEFIKWTTMLCSLYGC